MRRCDFKNSITNSSKPAGSSMQQACPVLGKILCTAAGINDAVFLPAASELSYSPLMTNVGTFIDPSREVMSVPPRARKIWPRIFLKQSWANIFSTLLLKDICPALFQENPRPRVLLNASCDRLQRRFLCSREC